MSDPIIKVEGLGKAYRLGMKDEKYPTFRDAIWGMAKAPIRRFQHLSGGGNQDELFWALKDVSFEVSHGEVVGIIGRNGAGKSTLLKVLSRITEPTSGRAVLRGRVASLLEVGTGFHPELTGRENVFLNGSILGMQKEEIQRKFDEIVAFAEVEKFLDTPVKRYSSGMYVRLAFAVAAHLEPEILIVDEVLAVGDAQFQKKCLGKMQDVAKGQGRTVLFVSHNMSAVRNLCSHGLFLAGGQVVEFGDVDHVSDTYLTSAAEDARAGEVTFVVEESSPAFRIAEAFVSAGNRERSGVVRSGESFAITIVTDADTPQDQSEVMVTISDAYGNLVTTLTNRFTTTHQRLPAGRFMWRCDIDHLYVTEGVYFVSLMTKNRFKSCDVRESALSFEIEGSASGMNRRPERRFGHTFPPQQWDIQSVEASTTS